jgi:hypothetical protein
MPSFPALKCCLSATPAGNAKLSLAKATVKRAVPLRHPHNVRIFLRQSVKCVGLPDFLTSEPPATAGWPTCMFRNQRIAKSARVLSAPVLMRLR